jgi:dehydrogenase/reductase SDR family protein 12
MTLPGADRALVSTTVRKALFEVVDRAMDLTIIPGFSSIGYGVRERLDPWEPPDLDGRAVMVTGASSGLGLAIAGELTAAGAEVHAVCRDPERGRQARALVARETGIEFHLHFCDLADLSKVREFARAFLADGLPLDVLINNAGVMPPRRAESPDGYELTFATNVLGPFLLTEMLLPRLMDGDDPRVVMMSSGGMYTTGFSLSDPQLQDLEYDPPRFYAHTKRAEVMLADEWQARYGQDGIAFCSMHPGWAETPGVRESLPRFTRLMGPILREPEGGAQTAVWLASVGPDEAPGGRFYQDRRPRPKYRLPGTRDEDPDRVRLYEICREMTGLDPD